MPPTLPERSDGGPQDTRRDSDMAGTGKAPRLERRIAAAAQPLLAAGERIEAAGMALLSANPVRERLRASARTGFMLVVQRRANPYVLTDRRLLFLNPDFRSHLEVRGWLDRSMLDIVEAGRFGVKMRRIVLADRRTGQRLPLAFDLGTHRQYDSLLAALRGGPDRSRFAQEPPVDVAHKQPAARRPTGPWTAGAEELGSNREGLLTDAQRRCIVRQGLGDSLRCFVGGAALTALLGGIYAAGYMVVGVAPLLAAAMLVLSPAPLVRAMTSTRPGKRLEYAAGRVHAQLCARQTIMRRGRYTLTVGDRRLVHGGDLVGLIEGAPSYAYVLPRSGRVVSMELIDSAWGGAVPAA